MQPHSLGEISALLAQAKTGSGQAIGELLKRHRAYLWALANEQLAGETELTSSISDVVQSAQLEAVRGLATFRGSSGGEFRSWLRQILQNNVIDLKRRRDRGIPRADGHNLVDAEQFAGDDRSPSSHVAAAEIGDKLRAAIGGLPSDERTIIEMHYFDGKTYAEISKCVNRTPEAVRKLWGRALVRLQSAAIRLQ